MLPFQAALSHHKVAPYHPVFILPPRSSKITLDSVLVEVCTCGEDVVLERGWPVICVDDVAGASVGLGDPLRKFFCIGDGGGEECEAASLWR